jgi:hypothetical protein
MAGAFLTSSKFNGIWSKKGNSTTTSRKSHRPKNRDLGYVAHDSRWWHDFVYQPTV